MARSTISIARSTPAQNPRGWASTTRMPLVPLEPTSWARLVAAAALIGPIYKRSTRFATRRGEEGTAPVALPQHRPISPVYARVGRAGAAPQGRETDAKPRIAILPARPAAARRGGGQR